MASTQGFPLGTSAIANSPSPTIAVQTGLTAWTTVQYTGITATSFTGCTGGTGTLSTGNTINTPVVWYDPGAYWGQAPNAFASGTQLVQGTQYAVILDNGGGSQGLIRKIGGAGAGFIGYYPESFYSGKLSAYRMPTWPRGDGNIKVAYTAGFVPIGTTVSGLTFSTVPLAIQNACTQL